MQEISILVQCQQYDNMLPELLGIEADVYPLMGAM